MVLNRNPFRSSGGGDLAYLPDVGSIGQCRRNSRNVKPPKRLSVPDSLFAQSFGKRARGQSIANGKAGEAMDLAGQLLLHANGKLLNAWSMIVLIIGSNGVADPGQQTSRISSRLL
jgi:hypothetical protein